MSGTHAQEEKNRVGGRGPRSALEVQRDLELKIKNLLEQKAPVWELQKAYDEFHSHILRYGIRGRPSQGYLYKKNLSLIDQLFLKRIGAGKSVLEIGIGDGHFAIACYRKGNSVKGIDISEVVIHRLKAVLKRERITVELKLGDARHLTFPDETFDYVVGKDLIEHLPEADLQIHLREVWRVLKPTGCYLIWTPSKLLGCTSLGAHLREYTSAEIVKELRNVRFRPFFVNLHFYVIFRLINEIPHSRSIASSLLKYEGILERISKGSGFGFQNPLVYLFVPPICFMAYKDRKRQDDNTRA